MGSLYLFVIGFGISDGIPLRKKKYPEVKAKLFRRDPVVCRPAPEGEGSNLPKSLPTPLVDESLHAPFVASLLTSPVLCVAPSLFAHLMTWAHKMPDTVIVPLGSAPSQFMDWVTKRLNQRGMSKYNLIMQKLSASAITTSAAV